MFKWLDVLLLDKVDLILNPTSRAILTTTLRATPGKLFPSIAKYKIEYG